MTEWDSVIWTVVYTLLSMITRFWQIGAANYVVWDEVSSRSSFLIKLTGRHTLVNSDRIISIAISTLTFTLLSAKCLSVSLDSCRGTMEVSSSNREKRIPMVCPTRPCESCSHHLESCWFQSPGGPPESWGGPSLLVTGLRYACFVVSP